MLTANCCSQARHGARHSVVAALRFANHGTDCANHGTDCANHGTLPRCQANPARSLRLRKYLTANPDSIAGICPRRHLFIFLRANRVCNK